jgi:hypothetical protein
MRVFTQHLSIQEFRPCLIYSKRCVFYLLNMWCDGPGNFMNTQCISGEISYTGCLKSIDTLTIYLALSFSLSVCFERIFILFDMNLAFLCTYKCSDLHTGARQKWNQFRSPSFSQNLAQNE